MAEHHPSDGGERTADPAASEGTERVREVIRDGFAIMLGAAWWAFDKTDQWAHTFLHEGKAGREESLRRFDEFAARTRRAGEDLGRRVQDSVRTARTSMPLASREQVANLERQVAELTREIESMRSTSAASSPHRDNPGN
jgi:polyhydroxyalkanoate synthesis regulator phasin